MPRPTDAPDAPDPTEVAPDRIPPAPAAAPARTALVAFDPGRRIGVAWVDAEGRALARTVVDAAEIAGLPVPSAAEVVLGDGTGCAALEARLERRGLAPQRVDERGTSLLARRLYFADHPPRGLARLVPTGLRHPPRPIDDYAALAIARRHLAAARPEVG